MGHSLRTWRLPPGTSQSGSGGDNVKDLSIDRRPGALRQLPLLLPPSREVEETTSRFRASAQGGTH